MKWFNRSKPKQLNQTTRLYSLYGESANLSYLENKINEVKNQIDNLPSVDLSNVAKKNEVNEWTAMNTFKGELKMLNKINMSGYKVYNLVEPSDNWDAATKRYVDGKEATLTNRVNTVNNKVSNVETELNTVNNKVRNVETELNTLKYNTPRLTGEGNNTWDITNVFSGPCTFGVDLNMFGNKIEQLATPTNDRDAVNKQYVDEKLSKVSTFAIYKGWTFAAQNPQTWNDASWRYFHYPESSIPIQVEAPNNIEPGDYAMNVCWVINFNNNITHRTTCNIVYTNIRPGQTLNLNPKFMSNFIVPMSFGLPRSIELHSVIAVKVM